MTKERARERAKSNALKKAKKRAAKAKEGEQHEHGGKFNAGASSTKGPHGNANAHSFGGGGKRGSARSK